MFFGTQHYIIDIIDIFVPTLVFPFEIDMQSTLNSDYVYVFMCAP